MHKYSSSVVGKMTVFLGYNLSSLTHLPLQLHNTLHRDTKGVRASTCETIICHSFGVSRKHVRQERTNLN